MKKISHLAMIMDGNRRWAKKHMLQPTKGHAKGAETLETLLKYCQEKGIYEITLYAFSMQNFNRSELEVTMLVQLMKKMLTLPKHVKDIHDKQVQVQFLGRTHLFDEELQNIFSDLEESTKNYTKHKLNFCVGYGGREEVTDATKAIAKDVATGKITQDDITEELIDSYMYTKDKPDLIIRTGGDYRTSNFLIWQSTYSEWFFIPETWPELTATILETIFAQFQGREQRFGK